MSSWTRAISPVASRVIAPITMMIAFTSVANPSV